MPDIKIVHKNLAHPMSNVMVDLETLGKRPGCVVLSIGAVFFDRDYTRLGSRFSAVINSPNCLALGLHEDPDTVRWWAQQSEAARLVLDQAYTSRLTLGQALEGFAAFLQLHGATAKTVKVWGNGADFDNAILQHCYAAVGQPVPWQFWNNRCYRTLKNLLPLIQPPERVGTHHNALDDARHQATHAIGLLRAAEMANQLLNEV